MRVVEMPEDFSELVKKDLLPKPIVEKLRNIIESLDTQGIEVFESTESVTIRATEYKHKLGTVPLPNEWRIHRKSLTDIRFQVRHCEADIYVTFKHPSLNDFLNDAITCAIASITTSILAAVVLQNPAVGYAIFYPAWKAYMVVKVGIRIANEFEVALSWDKRCTDWG